MKLNRFICIIAVIFTGLVSFSTFAQDDHSNLVGYIASDSAINVRNRPNGAVVASLRPNISVTVLETSADGNWISVDLGDGKSGWVSASFVRVVESAVPADLVAITPENAAQLEKITQLASTLANGLAFSPDGTLLATYSWLGTVEVYDVRTKVMVAELTKHTDVVSDTAFSPDGKALASSSWDGSVKIWDTQTWGERTELLGHTDKVTAIAYSPDGTLLASVGEDALLNIWKVQTGERLHMIDVGNRRMQNLAFSPDGSKIAAASDYVDSAVIVWDVASGEQLWRKSPGGNLQIAFSPDGTTLLLASGGSPGISGLDVATAKQLFAIPGTSGSAASIAINPSGTLVAGGTWDGALMVADIEAAKILFTDTSLNDAPDASVVLVFSPDGRVLMTSDSDHVVNLWGVHGNG